MQALLAHVILRAGGLVYDVRNPGHPDIVARFDWNLLKLEVEVASRKKFSRQLDSSDIEGLKPVDTSERGYFCVLDCGPPLAWLCVNIGTLGDRIKGPLRLSLLRAYADRDISDHWSAEFADLVLKEARNLRYLTYSLLREEALNGRFR